MDLVTNYGSFGTSFDFANTLGKLFFFFLNIFFVGKRGGGVGV